MDPEQTLEEMRELAVDVLKEADREKPDKVVLTAFAVCLAERVQSLDTWLSDGGFTPKAWLKPQ